MLGACSNLRPFAACAAAALTFAAGAPSGLAQPVSAQSAVSSSLGAPLQPKVATPPPSASARPGEGGGLEAALRRQALAEAIAANDVVGILANGGSPTEVAIAKFIQDHHPDPSILPQVAQLYENTRFMTYRGQLIVGSWGNDSNFVGTPAMRVLLDDLTLPGGNEGLPSIEGIIAADPGPRLRVPDPEALPQPLPPGPVRTLPEIPPGWLKAP